ncbi:MAG: biotin--protein ligase [Gammaproteobacteria bacterium]
MPDTGRWLDLGSLGPLALHAAYAGVAQAMTDEASPVLIWARADRPHISLGASQSAAAELDLAACRENDVEIVPRPLGGGTVLIDPAQYGVFLVVPRRRLGERHSALFAACLPAMAAVMRDFGLEAKVVGATDVWVDGRKIAGSGAATIGRALVFGASFLLRFDAELFARLVDCPSPGFRRWLAEALGEGMTTWTDQAVPPPEAELTGAVRRHFARALECDWRDGAMSAAERASVDEAREELVQERDAAVEALGARRLVANGIKVNHRTYLVEDAPVDDARSVAWLRLCLRDGRIARIECAEGRIGARLQACVGATPETASLGAALAAAFADEANGACEYWAGRIERLAADVRRVSSE